MPSQEDGGKLYPPNPSFYRASDASSSRNTLAESASGSQSSLPSATSLSPSPISESTGRPRSGQMSRPPSSHSRPRVPSASRGQRLSQISDSPTSGSGFTGRSVATSHHGGPPHRPGSSVQIVLPAPLASQAVYAREGQPMYNNPLLARSSVYADQWLTANGSDGCSTSDEAMVMPLTKSRSRSRHRPAASVPNVSQDPVPSSPRTASQHSPASRSRSRLRKQRHEDGAQADVPARYSNLADLAESVYESDGARGRSRRQTQLEIIPSGRISHSSSSNPLDR
ncbi:uncharacterized protein PHACADRAFT_190023 [Phanerochaete carnosa HHB-10118-sp]|uniref:Uncharacterized protein n=1 Tax=Phanerochaete carnosa (strain HHB-10118-sp) TaxID=650164 RepID=K5VD59_PHACS|nr:uncharacterized protein PHACADRAFT_190023 [Phanerochaete carnosa HHB-10118-sp]EKM60896.1 hypothetical protein PHACADRAFT_190023 [Phanerochaete carnosa HHB-10118-sp]